MKKLIQILTIVSLMLALVPVAAFAHTAGDPFTTDLIAGGGNEASEMDVGDVLVWNDGDYLYVKYEVTDEDWCITETHLEVAVSLGDIPQKNGNPIPGKFTYKNEHNCVASVVYQPPLSWDPDTPLLIAAHAVVQTRGGVDGLEAALPDQVTILVTWPGLDFGAPSYFDVTVSGGTMLDGMYDGYCVDTDVGLANGVYQANVYSSYEELASGLVQFPENLDLINYIINQHYVGTPSPLGGTYTFGDVQRAIWELIEDGICGGCGTEPWTQAHVDEIVADALTNGEGFVPGCGDVLVVMLGPLPWGQILIIDVPVPCVEAETAWGDGLDFPGKNWATYFGYSVQ